MNADVLFINPGNHQAIYQGLADNFSAIEPPTWALLLAQSVRAIGYVPAILDANAERLSASAVVDRVLELKPRVICFVVYGQNPNSGTVNMSGTVLLANEIKAHGINIPIAAVGSHISALPKEVLKSEPSIDIVFCNEGVYALRALLAIDLESLTGLRDVRGIGFRIDGEGVLTEPESIVPQEKMDADLPGYAWDLLPFKERPLDLYRSHFWHAEYDHNKRTPFAAIYTSLGCMFHCNFCMINILNRNDNDDIGVAGNYAQMRFWSPELMIGEFEKLIDMGVQTLRISDEMFLLNKKYYVPLCEMLRDRGYGEKLSMWAYSRIDTVKDNAQLQLIRAAGIKWLCLGIENAEKRVRMEVTKGKFADVDIRDVVKIVHDADVDIIANYLFGLPGDDHASMQKTLELGLSLCTVAWNGYAAMALPGSALYKNALEKNQQLPSDYTGYSFHSYDTIPLPTDHLTPEEILKFRDDAFQSYHTDKNFLEKIRGRYGERAVKNIREMTKVKLKRKILGD